MTPREIYQTSLRLFNGGKYDKVTSQFELNEKYPVYGRCFYTQAGHHESYIVFSIKGDLITINTNIISMRQFELENGRKWNGLEQINYQGGAGHTHPKQIINYEDSLSRVVQYIRNNRIDYVIQNEI